MEAKAIYILFRYFRLSRKSHFDDGKFHLPQCQGCHKQNRRGEWGVVGELLLSGSGLVRLGCWFWCGVVYTMAREGGNTGIATGVDLSKDFLSFFLSFFIFEGGSLAWAGLVSS